MNIYVLIYKIYRKSEIQTDTEKRVQSTGAKRPKTEIRTSKMRKMYRMSEGEAKSMDGKTDGRTKDRQQMLFCDAYIQ